jgi:hypothetical protein
MSVVKKYYSASCLDWHWASTSVTLPKLTSLSTESQQSYKLEGILDYKYSGIVVRIGGLIGESDVWLHLLRYTVQPNSSCSTSERTQWGDKFAKYQSNDIIPSSAADQQITKQNSCVHTLWHHLLNGWPHLKARSLVHFCYCIQFIVAKLTHVDVSLRHRHSKLVDTMHDNKTTYRARAVNPTYSTTHPCMQKQIQPQTHVRNLTPRIR